MNRSVLAFATLALLCAVPARADDPAKPGAETGVVFEAGTPPFVDVLAKAKAAGKPAFIDFSTEWCHWCRKLDKDVFTQPAVADVMKGFVNVHVDAEKGEGVDLAKRYGVHVFPTLVVVDASGDEIDRVVGYMEPDAFVPEMKRIASGEGTLPWLRTKVAQSPDDVETTIVCASKLCPTKPAEAAKMLGDLADRSKSKDRAVQARLRLEQVAALEDAGDAAVAGKAVEALVRDFGDTAVLAELPARAGKTILAMPESRALALLENARAAAKEPEQLRAVEGLTFSVLSKGMAAALRRQAEAAGDDPGALNAVAWTCFEKKINVKEAVEWARRAVEKSERDPAILDTLANLLWLTDAKDEAMKLETEAAAKAGADMKKEFEVVLARWKAELAATSNAK